MKKRMLFLSFFLVMISETCFAIEMPDALKDFDSSNSASKKAVIKNTPAVKPVILSDDDRFSIELCQQAIIKDPDDEVAYKKLVKLQEKNGLTDDAIITYFNLAYIYERYNMPERAKNCYENIFKFAPNSEELKRLCKTVDSHTVSAKINYYPIKKPKSFWDSFWNYKSEVNTSTRFESSSTERPHFESNATEKTERISGRENTRSDSTTVITTFTPLNTGLADNEMLVTKSDGSTYIKTKPDGDKSNNYSTKGNINPHTGKAGTQK